MIFDGVVARFWNAHWRFAAFITYPHVLLLCEVLGSLCIAFACWKGLQALSIPAVFSVAAAAAVFVVVLSTLLKYTGNRTYLLYLLSDTIWTWQFAHHQQPEWDVRIDRFAQYLARVARNSDAEEIVVVDHSSGSILAIEIVARALDSIRRSDGTARASFCSRSAAIFRSSVFTRQLRISAITCANWRSHLRSTGSTTSRARTL